MLTFVTAELTVEFGLFGIRAVVQNGGVTGIDGRNSVRHFTALDRTA